MKIKVVVFLAVSLIGQNVLADDNLQANIDEGKEIIQAFMGDLQSVLQTSMKASGPLSSIQVCNTVAPELSASHSQSSGWQVARTSLKVRNHDNAPDAREREVLEEFELRRAAGEDPMQISKAEVVEENGRKTFRMMKAIPTGEVCTSCHGREIAEPVRTLIGQLYPQDQAQGFNVGDLRGAFTLKKLL